MVTQFPARGQKAPQFWDQQLKAYVDESTDGAKADAEAKYVAKPAVRRAFAPLTAPNTNVTTAVLAASFPGLSLTQRSGLQLAVNTTRWRVRWRNVDLLGNVALTTPATATGVTAGDDPLMRSGGGTDNRWLFDFGSAPDVLTSAAHVVPVNGGWVSSQWFDNAGDQYTAGVFKGLSWDLAWASSGTGLAGGNSYLGGRSVGAHAADAALSSATIGPIGLYLNVVVEYEFIEPCEVWIMPGDSNTIGYAPVEQSSTTIMNPVSPGSCLPHESWPMIAGAAAGAVVINLGVGSASPDSFVSPTALIWYADMLALCELDGALVSLGTNGMSTLTAFVTAFRAINTNVRALGIGKLFWTTITGRGYTGQEARLTAAPAATATSISTDVAITATVVALGVGFAAETVTATLPSTGSGPYTTTVTALVNAHEVGEPLWWSSQRILKQINNFLGGMPDSVNGIFDFERAMEAAPHSSRMDLRYEASDKLHRRRRAQVILASMVAPVLSRFKVGA